MRPRVSPAIAWFALASLASPSTARAQESVHPPPPAPLVKDEPAPSGWRPYDQFRDFKRQLPFKVNANLWLYYWQPLSNASTLSGGSYDGTMEIWAFRLEVEKSWDLFGFHVETRFRDGGRIPGGGGFGAASTSNVWFQEGWGALTPTPRFNLRIGKMYQKIGLYWDDSFFGNLLYYDGIMLNPDWGLTAEGQFEFAGGKVVIAYAGQYFLLSDGVQGSYTFGRERDRLRRPAPVDWRTRSPNAEGETDALGRSMTTVANTALGRLSLSLRPDDRWTIALGGTAATGVVNRKSPDDGIDDPLVRFTRYEADLTITRGNWGVFAEYLRQDGPGMRPADYLLGGVHGGVGRVSAHVDASWVRYRLDAPVEEFMIVPGIGVNCAPGLNLYLDYDEWQRKDQLSAMSFGSYDRSLLLAIDYYY
jgi:hypothetical protein